MLQAIFFDTKCGSILLLILVGNAFGAHRNPTGLLMALWAPGEAWEVQRFVQNLFKFNRNEGFRDSKPIGCSFCGHLREGGGAAPGPVQHKHVAAIGEHVRASGAAHGACSQRQTVQLGGMLPM